VRVSGGIEHGFGGDTVGGHFDGGGQWPEVLGDQFDIQFGGL
jgi:hypothetical protein